MGKAGVYFLSNLVGQNSDLGLRIWKQRPTTS